MTGPEWDLDLGVGYDGERFAETCHRGTHEVKAPRYQDDFFYVELEQSCFGGAWKPSGLRTSKADVWDFVKGHSVTSVSRTRLNMLIDDFDLGTPAHEEDGECPTRGRLLSWRQLSFGQKPIHADGWTGGCVRCDRYGGNHLGAHRTSWPSGRERAGA